MTVSVVPCTSQKAEVYRPGYNAAGKYWDAPEMRDTDYCITTRELANWIREKKLDFHALQDASYDSIFGESSGAGAIFDISGGVMEASLRTLYYMETGKAADEFLNFVPVRGLKGVKEASVSINDDIIHVAAISGLANARKFINQMKEKHSWKKYAFIEVMACPGGCIGGGGQPHTPLLQEIPAKRARMETLYAMDAARDIHSSWENEGLQALYSQFLGQPLSGMAEKLLHTQYINKHYILGRDDTVKP